MDLISVSIGLTSNRSESSGDIPGKTTCTVTNGTGISGSASIGRRSRASIPPKTANTIIPITMRQFLIENPTIPTREPILNIF